MLGELYDEGFRPPVRDEDAGSEHQPIPPSSVVPTSLHQPISPSWCPGPAHHNSTDSTSSESTLFPDGRDFLDQQSKEEDYTDSSHDSSTPEWNALLDPGIDSWSSTSLAAPVPWVTLFPQQSQHDAAVGTIPALTVSHDEDEYFYSPRGLDPINMGPASGTTGRASLLTSASVEFTSSFGWWPTPYHPIGPSFGSTESTISPTALSEDRHKDIAQSPSSFQQA